MKVTLLMPTLNEIEGLKAVAPRIKKEWVDEIVVVDGASKDGTPEYAASLGYRVIQQKRKGGTGAYLDAIDQISNDVVITFSPDGNAIPEKIPDLVAKMKEGYDLVVASRYKDGAKSHDDTLVTAFGNWMFTRLVNLLYGCHYTDVFALFRAWKTELLRSPDARCVHPLAGFELYLSVRCAKEKRNVAEIPGEEPKRIGGKSKLNPLLNGLAGLYFIIREKFRSNS